MDRFLQHWCNCHFWYLHLMLSKEPSSYGHGMWQFQWGVKGESYLIHSHTCTFHSHRSCKWTKCHSHKRKHFSKLKIHFHQLCGKKLFFLEIVPFWTNWNIPFHLPSGLIENVKYSILNKSKPEFTWIADTIILIFKEFI